MKINITTQTSQTVDLSDHQVNEIVKNALRARLNGGEYLRTKRINGKNIVMLKMDDPEWRHGSVSEVDVREATETDIAIMHVLNVLSQGNI